MSSEPAIKPKRVLTEAQRLAFLKGRETRMANLEKKRLEKEEALFVERTDTVPENNPKTILEQSVEISKPKIRRQKKIVDVKIEVPVQNEPGKSHLDVKESSPQKQSSSPTPTNQIQVPSTFQIDEDKIAEKVANHVYEKIASAKQTKKPRNPTKREPKPKPSVETVRPHAFTWI